MDDENVLQRRIEDLELENAYLKSLLEQAGISCTFPIPKKEAVDDNAVEEKDQGKRIVPATIREEYIQFFGYRFFGRRDVYALRITNSKGITGYYPQCDTFRNHALCPKHTGKGIKCRDCRYKQWTVYSKDVIRKHLLGNDPKCNDVIGIYPLLKDGTCRLMVFDFDNHFSGKAQDDYANTDESWKEEVDALRTICKENGIPALTERSRSGRGAHIWIFFDRPVSASLVRKFGCALLDKGAQSVNLKSFRYYDRMLPAQTSLEEGQLGNLIALPLQGRALKEGNSAFIDENWNAIPKQWQCLYDVESMSEEKIRTLLSEWNMSENEKENEGEQPWERTDEFHASDVDGKLNIVLSDCIYVQKDNLTPRIQNRIRRLAAFSNPQFYKNQANHISNYNQSRFIYLGYDDDGYICIPRGLHQELETKCKEAGIAISRKDKRSKGKKIDVSFTKEYRDNQKEAVETILKHDTGILEAAPGFGKTVVSCALIAERKCSTLIVLESRSLLDQWENALNDSLIINEEPPEYKTGKGKTRKRKSPIGMITSQKDSSTGIIDIAMAGSLFKKGRPHERLKDYGMVIVDECHHAASDTVSAVLKEVRAKYVYGVSATPERYDGKQKSEFMLIGPVRYTYSAKQQADEQGIPHYIIPRFTRTVSPERLNSNQALDLIQNSKVRTEQIVDDIRHCIAEGRTPVVLTKRVIHAQNIYEMVKPLADHVFLMAGNISDKDQKRIRKELKDLNDEESCVLIGTGQKIGEGFDFPRLDTLMIAAPVSWKGVVEQYAGRLNRKYPGKEKVLIYDYIDSHISVLDNMYQKRLKAYKKIGYSLYNAEVPEKEHANCIYDCDSFGKVFEKDLLSSQTEIVISSRTLARDKVTYLIDILKKRQEAGVRVTIVTWHPDSYRYGKDINRFENLELLRKSGFSIELVHNSCEQYAVIDRQTVWYGSMNLLSKEDVDDNIMRVESEDIAAELLELTFRKGSGLQQYSLPLYSE